MFDQVNKTIKKANGAFKRIIMLAAFGALAFSASAVFAQSPQPSPSPQSEESLSVGDYNIKSSIEIGARWRDISGSENKFRSDFNYKSGFRVFNSSFLMESKEKKHKFIDNLLINTSGWGADPSGFARVEVEKVGLYRFNANVRRVAYFNNLSNFALNEHTRDTKHNFGDFDLAVYPLAEKLKLNFGMSFDRNNGPGVWTIRAYGDEFPVNARNKTRANDFRAGMEAEFAGFNVSLSHGVRTFRDFTNYALTGPAPGNNPANTSALATFSRQFPVKGNSHYTTLNLHRVFARKLDLTGRVIYSSTETDSRMTELITGRDASNNIIDLDRFEISGQAKRPQTRADLGVTFFATDNFKLSDTFTFDQFSVNGGENFAETLFRRNAAGTISTTIFTASNAYRVTGFRRFVNTVEGDYQFNNRVAFHIGYRYTKRRIRLRVLDLTITSAPSPTNPLSEAEEEDNQTHTLIAGMKIKPLKNWVVFWDVEHGAADNVFTRVANYKFTNIRARSRWTFDKVAFNLSAITKDNRNPSQTLDIPPRAFGVDINTRNYSASVDWSPVPKLNFNGGYTYQHLTSATAIRVPINTATCGSTSICAGSSQYYVRDHYGFFDVFAQPHKRISFFASYRIGKDTGQGDRVSTALQNFITSYPYRLQSPEARVTIRLTKNIDWNVGYQYNDYRDKFTSSQNYHAHLPYTSVRIYLGRSER